MQVEITKPQLGLPSFLRLSSYKVDLSAVIVLTKKGLSSFFYNPASYIVAFVFLLTLFLLFYSSFFSQGQASLVQMFDVLPWLLIFLLPALTMGLFSIEKRDGTLEYLLTKPISIFTLLLAKYLTVVSFASLMIVLTFPLAIAVSFYGDLDWGVVLGQYIATLLMVGAFASIGMTVSLITENQIASFLLSILINFILLILGTDLIAGGLPTTLAPVIENLSLISHYGDLARGVVDLRNVLYFAAVIAIGFYLSRYILYRMKYPPKHAKLSGSTTKLVIFLLVSLLLANSGRYINLRVDLTERGLYTISEATSTIVGGVEDPVNIKVYASSALPAQFQPTLREMRNLLDEYDRLSANLAVTYTYISDDGDVNQALAEEAGIQQVQFNVVGNSELQLKNGYLGMSVNVGEQTEVIPFVDSTEDLEFQLTSYIYQLTNAERSHVAFLTTGTTGSRFSGYTKLTKALETQFEVGDFAFGADTELTTTEVSALIIVGGNGELTDTQRGEIVDYVKAGGTVLLLDNSVIVNATTQPPVANLNENSLRDLFAEFGVTVANNLVYDLASSESVSFDTGLFRTQVAYPYWSLTIPADTGFTVTNNVQQILTPWTSSIAIADDLPENTSVRSILTTTEFAGEQTGTFNIDIEHEPQQAELQMYDVMAHLTVNNDNVTGQAFIVGNSAMFSDDFIDYKQNLGFAMRLVEELTQDQSLSEIKIKDRSAPTLVFESEADQNMLRFSVPTAVVMAVLGIGLFSANRRRRKQRLKYVKSKL